MVTHNSKSDLPLVLINSLRTKLIYVDQCLAIWTRPTYYFVPGKNKNIMQHFLDERGLASLVYTQSQQSAKFCFVGQTI